MSIFRGFLCAASSASDAEALDGEAINGYEVACALAARHGPADTARMLARLMREAGDIWRERRQ